MRLWMLQMLSDFVRWRAHRNTQCAKRAFARAESWKQCEYAIIERVMRNVED